MSSAVGGAPPAHSSSDSLNGRNPTIPAIPTVNGSSSFDHSRKPSMTVTPAGTTGFTPNGGSLGGPQNKPNVQFGSMNAASSPAMGSTPPTLAHQANSNLSVNQLNHRVNSPIPSPSPIPQPANPSGGRPPSTFQGQGNGMVFGHQPDQDPSGLVRPVSQLQFGDNHMRRNSSQSIHSDMGNPGLPTGPQGRPYGMQGGRGRGSYQGYQQQQQPQFGPPYNNRGGHPNARGNAHFASGRGQQFQYQGSPHMGNRTPTMMSATPGGTPFMAPNQMMPMQGPNGVPYFQVNPPQVPLPPEPIRGKSGKRARGAPRGGRGRGAGRGATEDGFRPVSRDPASRFYVPPPSDTSITVAHVAVPLFPVPDLSPASGNFEHFLTHSKQTTADPSIQQHYNNQMGYYPQMGQYPSYMPQSPRPPFQQNSYGAPPMQQTYSNQPQPQPQSMSRQSSQMSVPDRPGSTMEQQPHTPSLPTQPPNTSSRTPSISTTKSNFTIPTKKSAAIIIKNAAGEVVDFKSQKTPASPAIPQPPTAVATPSIPTPPSRAESAAPESSHTRAESVSAAAKTADEKRKAMQEAVKARIAAENKPDTVEEKAEANTEEKAEETIEDRVADIVEDKVEVKAVEKIDIDAEALDAAKLEVKEAEETADALEQEAAQAGEKVEAVEPSENEDASSPSPTDDKKPAEEDEVDFDAIEAELAAAEAEEARREEEYAKKKAAAKEAQLTKEREEAEIYEANMKKAEREAEEVELAREKERDAGGSGDDESKQMFAALKKDGADTPASTDTPALETPGESGTATPVSDVSMGPPLRGLGPKRGKAAELTLDTKKPVEPPEPSATLKALQSARKLEDISKVSYPSEIASPNPALNENAPSNRGFKYDKAFLLQFQNIFKEKPSLDWDAKIRDALGDGETSARASNSARTPGMGNRSASNRLPPPGQNFGGMGTFGKPPLPAGTTSEQRFAASNAAMRGGPIAASPFAQFSRGNMAPPMGRAPSNNPLGIPGSPRVAGSSRGGSRAESKRNKHGGKHMGEENKSMPLTAGMQLGALQVSETGWKPHSASQPSLGPTPGGGDSHVDPGTVQRKVKAALNKMTPEKFDKIADQILEIAAQSKNESDGRTLRQVIQLTFEKATDEAHWAPMYAMFCRKMLESMSLDIKDENIKDKNGQVVAGGNLFRKYLLNRCQEEFERGWKINLPGQKKGESDEAVMLSDEYYVAAAAKRRGLGLVRFIGELFKLGMLTERIMHECVKKLVDYDGTPEDAEVESLVSLLRTIGKQLDDPESKAAGRMDVYFQRIIHTLDLPDLPSRLRFMLMDIVDLRKHHWISKDDNKGPKTIQEIRVEEQERARQAELTRLASQSGRGRGGGGGLHMGRGDARSFSAYGQMPPPDNSNRVNTDDLRRLGNRNAARNPSNTGTGSLGPSGMLGPRTNSNRRGLGPGSLLARGDDSGNSSRTGTPPASKDKDRKDESSTNAFSALAALENEGPASPPSNPASPPTQKSQPNIERARSRSPAKPTE